MDHPVLAYASSQLERPLACSGDVELLNRPRRALLVSRVERNVDPDSPWLRALRMAARRLIEHNEVLVAGTGRVPFDLALWMAKTAGGAAIIVLASPPDGLDLSLLPEQRLIVWPKTPIESAADAGLRDRLMGLLADRATAVLIRKGGNMAAAAQEFASRGIAVETVPQEKSRRAKNPEYKPRASLLSSWECLTHFTRDPDGAYSGESPAQYLAELASDHYQRRDAMSNLRRILTENKIRGSGRLTPDHSPMVSLTALPPVKSLALRHWRRGLHRWSFSPYGVAFSRAEIELLGGRPLVYADDKSVAHVDPRFVQPSDWSAEQEWRVAGDVDFRRVKDLIVVCAFEDEAKALADEFGHRTLWICER